MATALGVISHEVDMADIIFPKGSNDDWTNAVKDLSSFVDSYWKPYKRFQYEYNADEFKSSSFY